MAKIAAKEVLVTFSTSLLGLLDFLSLLVLAIVPVQFSAVKNKSRPGAIADPHLRRSLFDYQMGLGDA